MGGGAGKEINPIDSRPRGKKNSGDGREVGKYTTIPGTGSKVQNKGDFQGSFFERGV